MSKLSSSSLLINFYKAAGLEPFCSLINDNDNGKNKETQKIKDITEPEATRRSKKLPNKDASHLPLHIFDAKTVRQTVEKELEAIQTREEFRSYIEAFEGSSLRKTAKTTVFCDGNPQSPVMLVGEAPGRDEDLHGIPFVGKAGRLVDKMLASISQTRQDVYITNLLFWRPPGNRTPTPDEQRLFHIFLRKHIHLVAPKLIVCLGGVALKSLLSLDNSQGILRLRGRWFDYPLETDNARVLATLHPAYLLRSPAQKKLAWHDFISLRKAIETLKADTNTKASHI